MTAFLNSELAEGRNESVGFIPLSAPPPPRPGALNRGHAFVFQ